MEAAESAAALNELLKPCSAPVGQVCDTEGHHARKTQLPSHSASYLQRHFICGKLILLPCLLQTLLTHKIVGSSLSSSAVERLCARVHSADEVTMA